VFRVSGRHFSSVSRMWTSFFKYFAMWASFLMCFAHVDAILLVRRGRRKIENRWLRLYVDTVECLDDSEYELRGVLKVD
jgi:hypothetical protein